MSSKEQDEMFEKARKKAPKPIREKRKVNKGQIKETLLSGDDDDDEIFNDREKWR